MPELSEQSAEENRAPLPAGSRRPPPGLPPLTVTESEERRARDELRRQIAALERELGELFATAFPRRGIEFTVGAAGGPRVLGIADLERVRDRLAARLASARRELDQRVEAEERNRGLIERMLRRPEEHRWVRVSNEDIGEPGCRHWHSRPRWGILGMLLGWWRVKLSSGCPLATGHAPAASGRAWRVPRLAAHRSCVRPLTEG